MVPDTLTTPMIPQLARFANTLMAATTILKTLAGTLPTAGEILVLSVLTASSTLLPLHSSSGSSVNQSVKCADQEIDIFFIYQLYILEKPCLPNIIIIICIFKVIFDYGILQSNFDYAFLTIEGINEAISSIQRYNDAISSNEGYNDAR
jgi:hypothetical protein